MEGFTSVKSGDVSDQKIQVRVDISNAGEKRSLFSGKSRLVIGSVESADIRLSGEGVAPIHALLEVEYGSDLSSCRFRLVDLASPSGLSVNGVRVVNEEINPGDPIRVGAALLNFSFSRKERSDPLPDSALLLIDRNTVENIFDYSPAALPCLEVVVSFHGAIFEVSHFARGASVELSSDGRGTFTIPPVIGGGKPFRFLEDRAGVWTLHLDPSMRGVVYQKGKLTPVSELIRGNGGRTLAVQSGDFVKIQIGDQAFFISLTVSPPTVRKQSPFSPDPFLLRSFLVSLPISLMMLFGMGVLSMRLEDPVVVDAPPPPAPPGFVMTYPPELSKPPVEPTSKEPVSPKKLEVDLTKPVKPQVNKPGLIGKRSQPKKLLQSRPKEGEGARAAGAEGSRGNRNAPRAQKPIDRAFRPSANPGKDRGGVKSDVHDQAHVQMMKSALDSALDAIGGSGIRMGEAGSSVRGVGVMDTRGAGGRLIKSVGSGGGGTADQLLGGAGKRGTGAGKSGTGKATDGKAGGIISGGELGPLSKGDPEAVIVGAIDPSAIEQAIRSHANEFRYCYERELNAGNPRLSGKIFTTFVIGPSGLANQTAIKSSTVKNAMVEKCVLQVIRRITEFPKPAGGASVTVTFPFTYQNLNK
jgi:outer membrane biosynthesis protein TonB